jgi:hypothetical protein
MKMWDDIRVSMCVCVCERERKREIERERDDIGTRNVSQVLPENVMVKIQDEIVSAFA